MPRGRLVNVPNAVSLSRLGLAAAFVVMHGDNARLILVGIAALTDFLDGWIARMSKTTTRWGALIDPIADRAFALVAVSAFLFDGRITTLQYFVLLTRDIMTAVGFLVARLVAWLRPVKFQARKLGKLVTVLQLATFLAILSRPAVVMPLVILVGIASAASVVDYTVMLWRNRAQAA